MRVVEAFVKTLAVVATVGTCLVVVITLLMAISERTCSIANRKAPPVPRGSGSMRTWVDGRASR
jgi:hypothetical protein